jgi:ABC-type glycerol-3-phosphate transport system permease component
MIVPAALRPPGLWRRSCRFGRKVGQRGLLWTLNLALLCFFLFPFYVQTVTALESPADANSRARRWFPHAFVWSRLAQVLQNGTFQHAVFNSVVVASCTTVLSLLLGSCGAYAIAHLPLPRKRGILLALVISATIPPIVLVPSLYLQMRRLGLIDTHTALIIAELALALPFTTWVLANHFRQIPVALIEQAEVDGCRPVHALWRVVLPLALPGLAAAGLLTFIMVWNEFQFALTLSMSIRSATVPVLIGGYGGWGSNPVVASEIVTVPLVILALVGQRALVQSLSSGALKG